MAMRLRVNRTHAVNLIDTSHDGTEVYELRGDPPANVLWVTTEVDDGRGGYRQTAGVFIKVGPKGGITVV